MKRETCINFRTTAQEKERMEAIASRCGLNISEYLRKRALGYTPKALPTAELQAAEKSIYEILNQNLPPELEEQILALSDTLHRCLYEADKQSVQEIKEAIPWQPPACGR